MTLLELDLPPEQAIERDFRPIPANGSVCAFLAKATPVTNSEYARFIRATDYQTAAERRESDATWRAFSIGRSEHPALHLSWDDAIAYCLWQTRQTNRLWRLPSRAEWQWAARGGLVGALYPWGNDDPEGRCAAYRDQLEIGTMPVASFQTNGYGLYDPVGNVWKFGEDFIIGDDGIASTERYGGAWNIRRAMRVEIETIGVLEWGLTNDNTGFCPVISNPEVGSFRYKVEAAFVRLLRAMTPDGGGAYLRVNEEARTVSVQLVGTCVRCTKQRESGQDLVRSLKEKVPAIVQCDAWLVKGQRIVPLG